MIHIRIRRKFAVIIAVIGIFVFSQAYFKTIVAKAIFLDVMPYRTATYKVHDLILPDFDSFYYESVRGFVQSQCQVTKVPDIISTISRISTCIKNLAATKGAKPLLSEGVFNIDFIKYFSRKENKGYYKLECGAYTSILKAALTSYGFYVRRVDLSNFDYRRGLTYRVIANFTASNSPVFFSRHQALEVWDAKRAKWIYWDGFYDIYGVDGDSILSSLEIQAKGSVVKFVPINRKNNEVYPPDPEYLALFRQIALGKVLDSEYEMQLHQFRDEMGPAYRSFEWRGLSESSLYRKLNWEFSNYYSDDRDNEIREVLNSQSRR